MMKSRIIFFQLRKRICVDDEFNSAEAWQEICPKMPFLFQICNFGLIPIVWLYTNLSLPPVEDNFLFSLDQANILVAGVMT